MDLAYLRFCGTPAFGRDGLRRALDAPAVNPAPLFAIPAFPAMVLERAGLDPRCYRDVPLARRTAACVRALRAPSVGAAGERRAAEILTRISSQLAPRGLLVVGKAERPPAALPLRSLARCIYQTHG